MQFKQIVFIGVIAVLFTARTADCAYGHEPVECEYSIVLDQLNSFVNNWIINFPLFLNQVKVKTCVECEKKCAEQKPFPMIKGLCKKLPEGSSKKPFKCLCNSTR